MIKHYFLSSIEKECPSLANITEINVIDKSRLETTSGPKIEILEGGYRQQDERYKKYKKYKKYK